MNATTLNELLPGILRLSLSEKIRLIRILAEEMEKQAPALKSILQPGAVYQIHTPVFEPGAAAQLLQLLENQHVEV